jgi:hypothetical protein
MPKLILNRDVTSADVPAARYAELEPPNGGHPAAWAQLWRFALTFDPEAYAKHAGTELDGEALLQRAEAQLATDGSVSRDFSELRAMLWSLYGMVGPGASLSPERARLVDVILDAVYADVSGGKRRPSGEPGPYEPELGTFAGAIPGSGQRRFWFSVCDGLDRVSLFDGVAGLFLREIAETRWSARSTCTRPATPSTTTGHPFTCSWSCWSCGRRVNARPKSSKASISTSAASQSSASRIGAATTSRL